MKRKKKRILGRKISNQQWLKFKPYSTITSYDTYYINKTIGVYKILRLHRSWFDSFGFSSDDIGTLACLLTSHFEDFINEIGIWQFFQQTNKKLYGHPLPFYDLSDYDEDYLNPADFSYLIWHFMCKNTNRMFGPDAPTILEIGETFYQFFEPLIEDAPTTDTYDKLLKIEETTPFYEVKERLKWFALDSYTMGVEFSKALKDALDDYMLREDGLNQAIPIDQYAYAIQDDYFYAKHSSFSALSCLEWFAGIVNCSIDLKQNILNLKERIMSPLYFEGKTDDYWLFRQLQTNEIIKVVKASVTLTKQTQVKGYMQMMNLVKWKQDWWMSGTTMGYGQISETEKDKMRKDIASTPFYAYSEENQQKLRSATDDMEKYFIEYFGSPIVLFKNQRELQQAMQDQNQFYNEKKTQDNEVGKKVQKHDANKYKKSLKDIWGDMDFDAKKGVGLVFISGKGTMIDPDITNTINIMKAPSIDKEGELFLFEVLVGDDTFELVTNHLLDNYPTHNFKFPIATSKVDVIIEKDFLMRFLNPQGFKEPTPNTRHTVSENT